MKHSDYLKLENAAVRDGLPSTCLSIQTWMGSFEGMAQGWDGNVLPALEDRKCTSTWRAPSPAAQNRTGGTMTSDTFTAAAREQIRFIQDRLPAAARWADGSGSMGSIARRWSSWSSPIAACSMRCMNDTGARPGRVQVEIRNVDGFPAGCVVRTSWMNRTSSGSSIYAYA